MINYNFPFIKTGDVIEIIAPSGGFPQNNLYTIIADSEKFIGNLGFTPKIDPKLFSLSGDSFSANRLNFRMNSIIDALQNEESSAIWCLRGGYGAQQLIPCLQQIKQPKKAKLFAGFSDITALHLFFNQKWNIPTLHSRNLCQFILEKDVSNDEIASFKKLITGNQKSLEYDIVPLNHKAQNFSEAEAKIIGGNMTVIQTSIGTPWQIDGKGKIIFFEEVGERGYRIDRMFYHFEQAGMFEGVKAIVIGDVSPEKEANGTNLTEVAVSRFCARVNLPVFRINGIGHKKINNPLPLNINTLITKQKLKFIF